MKMMAKAWMFRKLVSVRTSSIAKYHLPWNLVSRIFSVEKLNEIEKWFMLRQGNDDDNDNNNNFIRLNAQRSVHLLLLFRWWS